MGFFNQHLRWFGPYSWLGVSKFREAVRVGKKTKDTISGKNFSSRSAEILELQSVQDRVLSSPCVP